MGMAPYGDPTRHDFSRLGKFENGELVINTDYANVIGFRRYKEKVQNHKNAVPHGGTSPTHPDLPEPPSSE